MPPRALVTGATGRIGSHVVEELLERQVQVRVLCLPNDPRTSRLAELGVEVVEGSLTEPAPVVDALDGVNEIFHLGAALTNRGASRSDIVSSIARGTFNVLEGIRGHGDGVRLLMVSSSSVYYSGSKCPYPGVYCDERTPIAPSTPYGAAKRAAELFVEAAVRNGQCSAVVVRPSDTADRSEIVRPHSIFGRRWFVQGAIDWYELSEPGTADRVSEQVYEQLKRQSQAELFYLVDRHGREPVLQVSDAPSMAGFLVDRIEDTRSDVPSLFNAVPDRSWPMGEFVRGIASMLGMADRVARIETEENAIDRWRFGTVHSSKVADALSRSLRSG